jgi:GTP-binding protein HflX
MPAKSSSGFERAVLVGIVQSKSSRDGAERSLDELAGLVAAAGGVVVLRALQERTRPDPATYLGKGKLQQLAVACDEADADLVVFDHELTPAQVSHIEPVVARRVVDRTQVILDIFARRARTREGKWQVELAQLRYLLPRLVGSSAALSRLGGGIGTRGPGETKLETDRRRIRRRIATVAEGIDAVRLRRARLRERRKRAETPTVALVGYTNAGKTTLFNLLTKGEARVSDALFVTLDPLVRRVSLPDQRDVLMSDTVGFIDRLPHSLIAAFRATLEEVKDADLLLHVIDAAAPDRDRRMAAVLDVLREVEAGTVPRIDVYNKTDLLEPGERERLRARHPESLVLSALNGDGRDALLDRVVRAIGMETQRIVIKLDLDSVAGRETLARIYRHGRVLAHVSRGRRAEIAAEMPRRLISALGLPVSTAPPAARRRRRRDKS